MIFFKIVGLVILTVQYVVSDTCNEKCFCKTVSIENLPRKQVKCSYENFTTITKVPYDVYELDYSHNNIKVLNGNNLIDGAIMGVLDLSYNKISTISNNYFSKSSKLVSLNLSHNRLQNLDKDLFINLNELQVLYLQFNNLANLPNYLFTPLSNLLRLDLSYNNIPVIENKDFLNGLGLSLNVTSLALNGIGLKTMRRNLFDQYSKLQEISLADNDLNELPILPVSLIRLDLSGNNFTELIARDFHYKNLKIMKLNRLRNLKVIHHYAFYHLTSLEELYIEHCPKLRQFNDLAFENINNNVNLPLKKFSLAGCGLESLNETYLHLFATLDSVDLQGNPWRCTCDISWFRLIHTSKLQGHDNMW